MNLIVSGQPEDGRNWVVGPERQLARFIWAPKDKGSRGGKHSGQDGAALGTAVILLWNDTRLSLFCWVVFGNLFDTELRRVSRVSILSPKNNPRIILTGIKNCASGTLPVEQW